MDLIRYPGDQRLFQEMLAMASLLGVRDLAVLDLPRELPSPRKSRADVSQDATLNPRVRVSRAIFITPTDLSRLSNSIAGKSDLVFASPEKACLEHPRVDAIIGAEGLMRKDRLHQRDSGMNLTSASIAGKGKKVLLLDLALLGTDRRAQVLGRFFQNARLAAKTRLPLLVVSGARNPYQMRSPADLRVLAQWLGIPPLLIREGEALLRSRCNAPI